MTSSTGADGTPTGLPPWLLRAIAVVALSLGGLFIAGQLGRAIGAHAGAEALRRGDLNRGGNAPELPEKDAALSRQPPRTIDLADRVPVAAAQTAAHPETPGKLTSNFVRLPLPKGVTVEIPKNWVALTDNQRVTLDSVTEAKQDLAGITRPESTLPFAANYYDDARNVAAMFNIRFYPEMESTQDFIRGLPSAEIADLDSELRKQTDASQRLNGMSLLEWKGTKRREINGIAAFVIEYRRTGARVGAAFCVRLVRVVNAGRSFTVTVSYREDTELLLRPICDRIIESIRQ